MHSIALLLMLVCVLEIALCGVLYFKPRDAVSSRVADLKKPRYYHVSWGSQPTDMVFTWSTLAPPAPSYHPVAWVGPPGGTSDDLNFKQDGVYLDVISKKFVDGGSQHNTQYIHRATADFLKPLTKYAYYVGYCTSPNHVNCSWSPVQSVVGRGPDGVAAGWSPRFAVFGDMGVVNAMSLPHLIAESKENKFDAILHVGDLAYDMASNNGTMGDKFQEMLTPLASVPYMTCVGNHENSYNFSNYKARFSMPNWQNTENMFYSFNVGPAHIIAVSTEFYFYLQFGWWQVVHQYKWLENDLKIASSPEQRAKFPWIILMGHRPMYCSNNNSYDCTLGAAIVRYGVPVLEWFAMERLLAKYGVDLTIWAHEHSYERMWPIYENRILNGSYNKPYQNPRGPVHIVTGSGGCDERHDPFSGRYVPSFSAFRSTDYGYSKMHILNATHLHWQQVSVDQKGKVIDDIWIEQQKHGPFTHLLKN